MVDERYVPVRLAAEGLGRSVRTIRSWVANDLVRHLRDERGGVWVFAPDLPTQHATRAAKGIAMKHDENTTPDAAALTLIESGDLLVDPTEGAIKRPDGRRAETVNPVTGYGTVYLGRTPSGRHKRAQAHRIVWMAAHGPIPDGITVNHKNGRRWDNRIENLELLSLAANIQHGHSIQRNGQELRGSMFAAHGA